MKPRIQQRALKAAVGEGEWWGFAVAADNTIFGFERWGCTGRGLKNLFE
jgi:hypothetical protein